MVNKFPLIETAEQELLAAGRMNPGLWIGHSRYVAAACKNIAEHCDTLNTEKAYILGLLHDIGRRVGIVSEKHLLEGYKFCMSKGWEDVAQICITHSFMIQDIKTAIGKWDVTEEDYNFINKFLASIQYSDYDKLVQLCDSLALSTGFCILEKRFVDVTRRYGVNEYTVARWNAVIGIKEYFENLIGCSIYDVLPGVRENTFEAKY
ncbi:HD domain-containing protein [Anaerocolumna sp. MB42-C2]|uniref:HD domain-containing protein n=1 Tax=Anaerocolumna sp. MB42-C2 TaxID=3070997 RepID=UPI0027E1A072|nr:HD domain-containing protein [Anaerocolumna sp. MB42-C2]WMJ86680.1 HDOD domain-containing protein [Anaerocolumna sp. MB42-C2]